MLNRDKVRLLITDTDREHEIFTNIEIDTFLEMEGSVVKLAAALALETIANNETLTLKRITLLDLTTDGPAVAAELKKTAALWRAQGDEEFDMYAVVDEDADTEEAEDEA